MDNRSVQCAPYSDRSMPSSHALPGPMSRKRTSTHLTPSLQPSAKRPKVPLGIKEARPIQHFKAESWFDDTNKDASGMNDIPFQDNDPPFYVGHGPSSDDNSICAVPSSRSNLSNLDPPMAPTRSLLARMESSKSNSEDFRSVIDDLTIQNKKLKKKLQKYEKLHCSHLQEEKLFEVRIYGLTAHRKRELEETLRSFASSIEEDKSEKPCIAPLPLKHSHLAQAPSSLHKPCSSSTSYSKPMDSAYASMSGQTGGLSHPQLQDQDRHDTMGTRSNSNQLAQPPSSLHKPSSSSTSHSKPVDSAYASMSGQTGGLSHSQLQNQNHHDSMETRSNSKQLNVKSYLYDMPQNLMPKHTLAMSDRSKSRLVVKRLEQIYTGKGAASRRHNQSHQQQEVSQSAAQADRHMSEARGRPSMREGVREAHILPADAELQVGTLSEVNMAVQQSRNDRGTSHSCSTRASRNGSPGQRPTRPLDLDLHRAQVPLDNIEYIRHLGLENPPADPDSEKDGWVYLNLLISMAQLHTLNVTPEFIRLAITNVSQKFELSTDGTKVRWQGGGERTRMSSDSDESEDVAHLNSMATSLSASKRGSIRDQSEPNATLPPESSEPLEGGKRRARPTTFGQSMPDAKFHYKPLFFHGAPTNSDDSGQASTSSPDIMENATGMDSGMNSGSHGIWEAEATLRRQNAHENGPIIFYHKARFCTDLSGDANYATIDEGAYRRYTQQPIGCHPDLASDVDYDTLAEATMEDSLCNVAMEHELDSVQDRSMLDLDELRSCISDTSTFPSSPTPMYLEVSGLAGIQPDDNFVVKVQVRHKNHKSGNMPTKSPIASPQGARGLIQRLPKRTVNPLHDRQIPRSQPQLEIVSTIKTDMLPSSLPPPSFLCIPFSSTDTDESDSGSDDQGETVSANSYSSSRHRPRPSYPPTEAESEPDNPPIETFIGSSPEESQGSAYPSTSSASESDDSSIDLLAHARVLDPDTIAEREREFDRHTGNTAIQPSTIPPPVSSAAATSGETSGIVSKGSEFPFMAREGDSDVDSMSVDGDGGSVGGRSA